MGTRRDFYWKGGVADHQVDPATIGNWYNRVADDVWAVEPGQAPETYDDYLHFDVTYDGTTPTVYDCDCTGWSGTFKDIEVSPFAAYLSTASIIMSAGMTSETVSIGLGLMNGGTVTDNASFSGDAGLCGVMTGGAVGGDAVFDRGSQLLGGTITGDVTIDCTNAANPVDQGPAAIGGNLTLYGNLMVTLVGTLTVGGSAYLHEVFEVPFGGAAVVATGTIRVENPYCTNQAIFETPLLIASGATFPAGLDSNGIIRILGDVDCSSGISTQTRVEVYGRLTVATEAMAGQTDRVDLMTPEARVIHPLGTATIRADRMPKGGVLTV